MRRSEAGCLSFALALAGLIRWELTPPPPVPAALTAWAGPAPFRAPLPGAAQEGPAALASSVLRRPLFRADRRPAPAAAPDASTPPLPRLTGIVVTASARRAIFAGGQDGKPVAAAEGERIGPVRVARIGAREVVMVGPDGAHVLRPVPQSAEPAPPLAAQQPGNAVSAAGATFGAIPADRLALLRGHQAASLRRLRMVR